MEFSQHKTLLQGFDCHFLAENVWEAIHTDSPNERKDPKSEHPIFYGCYDWHSAVHSHCTIILLLDMMREEAHDATEEVKFALLYIAR